MNQSPRLASIQQPGRVRATRLIAVLLTAAILAALLSGCNYPGKPTQPAANNPAYTQAAETIAAQLTVVARGGIEAGTAQPAEGGNTTAGAQAGGVVKPATPAVTIFPTLVVTEPPTATPTPLATATPRATLTPTPLTLTSTLNAAGKATASAVAKAAAAPVEDPKAGLGKPSFHDTFSDASNWPVFADKHASMEVRDNSLRMTAMKAEKWDSWMVALPVLQNSYVETSVKTGTCAGRDRYGLVTRSPDGNRGYLFGVSCEGTFSLRAWDGKAMHILLDWTASPFIQSGADKTNVLGIKAEGSQLSLYINGHRVAQAIDRSYPKGSFGLFIGAAKTDNFTVQVTEITAWKLP